MNVVDFTKTARTAGKGSAARGAAVLAVMVAISLCPRAEAQQLSLLKGDGSRVEGQLKSFEDGVYVLTTPQGEISVDVSRIVSIQRLDEKGGAPPGAAQPGAAAPEANAAVVITTYDQKQVTGRIVSFADGIYEVQTSTGLQTIAVGTVKRIEPAGAQPKEAVASAGAAPNTARISVATSRAIGETVLKSMIETYASSSGATNPSWTRKGSVDERTFNAQTSPDAKYVADVSMRGATTAVDDLIAGRAEIAILERPMTAFEQQRVKAAALNDPTKGTLQENTLAPSGVVVLVHPSNPVKRLTLSQVSDIFSGRIRNWSELGGASRRIQVIAPFQGSGILDLMKSRLPSSFDLLPTSRRIASSLEIADVIAADSAAIGMSDFDAIGNTTPLTLVKECGLTSEASPFNIQSQSYPLASHLFAYSTTNAKKPVRDFLSFAQSPEMQTRLRERGYLNAIPVQLARGAIKFDPRATSPSIESSPRFNEVVSQFVNNAARLSITFRFDGQALDAQSVRDIEALVAFTKNPAWGGRSIALVGYASNSGNFNLDVNESKARAVLVADILRKRGLTVERLFGFGPLMPSDCDTPADTAPNNRRVEVWVE